MLKPVDYNMGLIPDEIFQELEDVYNINIEKVLPYVGVNNKPIFLNKRSETSRKIIIKIEQGYFMLKEIPWYIKTDYIKAILSLQNELHFINGKSPKILMSNDESLSVNLLGKEYFIQEFIFGNGWSYNRKQAFYAGKVLREFHKNTKKFITSPLNFKTETIMENAKGILNLLMRNFKKRRNGLTEQKQKLYLLFIKKANMLIKRYEKELLTLFYGKDRVIVHGDYNPNNITFSTENEIKSIYDYDNVCIDDPIHDIAEGLVDFSVIEYKPFTSMFQKMHINSPQKELFTAFYRGYFSDYNDGDNRLINMIPSAMIIVLLELCCLGLIRNDWEITLSLNYLENLERFHSMISSYLFELRESSAVN
ncbi:phosphotransferase [Bacillus aquiflavi]|uniref:Phosphotransferase n=1 Tax=Bacillus aquiflavi TaxID=2672567 RepID=A0A6B3VYT3_9BACI|nr:phosphotransferase [Bacillus aquiflavi]MBA4536378.1 phosphotransferase [Bacillus aquiflavi]NEY80746.1 phosphotransferase [Bacillus aquiflavi]UAC48071.1 phosphotransferase [Bacillus aquiflavi]